MSRYIIRFILIRVRGTDATLDPIRMAPRGRVGRGARRLRPATEERPAEARSMSSTFRPSLAFGVLLTVAVIATQVTAQDASEADVVVTNNEQYGPVLTTPDGMSVYLYVLDEAAAST